MFFGVLVYWRFYYDYYDEHEVNNFHLVIIIRQISDLVGSMVKIALIETFLVWLPEQVLIFSRILVAIFAFYL